MKKRYDENGMRLQTYQRGGADLAPITGDDAAAALIDIGIKTLRTRPQYANTEEGFRDFQNRTIKYFEYVQSVNRDKESNKRLMIDVESWAVYMGTTRQIINRYTERGGEWEDFINRVKEIISGEKKLRVYSHQAPPIFAIFDMVNNHYYHNTSDIRIEAEKIELNKPTRTPAEIARIIEQDIPIDDDAGTMSIEDDIF